MHKGREKCGISGWKKAGRVKDFDFQFLPTASGCIRRLEGRGEAERGKWKRR